MSPVFRICVCVLILDEMKKIIVFLAGILFLCTIPLLADNERAVSADRMPKKARMFLMQYFPEEKVLYAKKECEFFEVTYEVVFMNGDKVKFRGNGKWKQIDCRRRLVPPSVVPPHVSMKIQDIYPGSGIVEIERDCRKVEVKMMNGMELTFDRRGNLMGLDD